MLPNFTDREKFHLRPGFLDFLHHSFGNLGDAAGIGDIGDKNFIHEISLL
jgi:hypothetical protein